MCTTERGLPIRVGGEERREEVLSRISSFVGRARSDVIRGDIENDMREPRAAAVSYLLIFIFILVKIREMWVSTLLLHGVHASLATPSDDEALVESYVAQFGNLTFREPSGALKYKYLVPGGFYQQLWDWDSMFTGIALLQYGSAPYLAGSMKNFFSQVNLTDGTVKGCLTPEGASQTIYHAKPVLIQGALVAAKHTKNFDQYKVSFICMTEYLANLMLLFMILYYFASSLLFLSLPSSPSSSPLLPRC